MAVAHAAKVGERLNSAIAALVATLATQLDFFNVKDGYTVQVIARGRVRSIDGRSHAQANGIPRSLA